jgi:hypothetical protein
MKLPSCALVFILFMLANYAHAQIPVEPTSATDSKVKIEKHHKSYRGRLNKHGKKLPGETRVFERQNRSSTKEKHTRSRHHLPREARVFQHQNHFARKENISRSRHRNSARYKLSPSSVE